MTDNIHSICIHFLENKEFAEGSLGHVGAVKYMKRTAGSQPPHLLQLSLPLSQAHNRASYGGTPLLIQHIVTEPYHSPSPVLALQE